MMMTTRRKRNSLQYAQQTMASFEIDRSAERKIPRSVNHSSRKK
jgi:hypothetical protein